MAISIFIASIYTAIDSSNHELEVTFIHSKALNSFSCGLIDDNTT